MDRHSAGVAKAVIVAAGSGSRLPGPRPKQFRRLGGRTLIERGLDAASRASRISSIVLVLPPSELAAGRTLVEGRYAKLSAVVAGGARRQDSVSAGAAAAGECDVIVVHDAARPFAPPELFDAVAMEAERCGAAIAAVPVADTVKEVDETGRVRRTLDRSGLALAQTPQAFRRQTLMDALDRARAEGIVATDEASLVERFGGEVRVVPSSRLNMKVTDPEDLPVARALAGGDPGGLRVGAGEDQHPLRSGRPLVLGGVTVPFGRGLRGHSDGDALVHAIVDALCGAAGLPTIGELFPDTDPAWRGASSLEMLRRVASRLAELGWEIVNIDSVVLCDAPRIAPHAAAMKERIASALGSEPSRIGVKGKSAEGLGAEGRGEGISARAVALIRTVDRM